MDLTKDIIDFTQKPSYTELKAADPKLLTDEDYNTMFESVEKSQTQSQSHNLAEQPLVFANPRDNTEQVGVKVPSEHLQKPTTPQLIENTANVSTIQTVLAGDVSPPPRPLTSSEVVGFTAILEDPEMQLDPSVVLNKCRSLPASPNHLKSSHINDLFAFPKPEKHRNEVPPKQTHFLGAEKMPDIIKSNGDAVTRNNQQFCLRWNNYQTNLTNVFDELLQNESFVDVTLACEGQSIKAHKMILSACSPYFQALFYDNPCQHPIVIMRDVRWQELKALMEFMYKGEINVSQEQINPLLKVAEMLKIRGLAEVGTSSGGMAAQQLIPEQRMTVFEDDDEEDDTTTTANGNVKDEEKDNNMDCSKAKRARIQMSPKITAAMSLNSGDQRQRKRSRDGEIIEDDRLAAHTPSRSPTPPPQDKYTACTPPPSVVMTASTIVRNPFASPNPTNQPAGAATSSGTSTSTLSSSSSSASGSVISASSVSSASAALGYRPRERSCSPSVMSAHSIGAGNMSLTSPTNSSNAQISIHPHPAAAAAAAAALANPHHPHLHAAAAAQQFAAQQQLHAAHSHAAMASALGASLAAAAAGSANSAGPTSSAGSSSHHEDMEIKPEIAEMIREEERVS
ncbi:hypothetical protein DOY81_001334 [Sarcophaga bullata]|nr:hypothetical protein DOY81_001334 [Sarcophaga bullata]